MLNITNILLTHNTLSIHIYTRRGIKIGAQVQFVCIVSERELTFTFAKNATKIALVHRFNSSTRVNVYAECIYVLTEYLKY